jgi:arylsulfatase A-like enzyme
MYKIHSVFWLSILFGILLPASCSKGGDDMPQDNTKPNILLIIADDLGKDALKGFSEGTIKPNTPNLDAIRNDGLTFTNFWVNPTCTPTRAAILTGKYGYRTGVKGVGDVLSSSEQSIQHYLRENTNEAYATALVGKWHLSGNDASVNQESFGIDYYAGLIRGAVDDYYQWQLTEDGTGSMQTGYCTEVFTDLSIDWIKAQSKPWFLWLAYNAPHTPFHVPPGNMHSQGNLPPYTNGLDPMPYYMAAIEAMDYQIGRLLDEIPADERANTVVIFLGDNGSPNQVAQSPYSSSTVKGTLYQGGINTPMLISGKGVSRTGTDDNLICNTDLFATIAELAGINLNEINDSKSFKSLFTQSNRIRNYQYSELKDGLQEGWTIRNENYKILVDATGDQQLYNLTVDPYEANNLLLGNLSASDSDAKTELETELGKIRQ